MEERDEKGVPVSDGPRPLSLGLSSSETPSDRPRVSLSDPELRGRGGPERQALTGGSWPIGRPPRRLACRGRGTAVLSLSDLGRESLPDRCQRDDDVGGSRGEKVRR